MLRWFLLSKADGRLLLDLGDDVVLARRLTGVSSGIYIVLRNMIRRSYQLLKFPTLIDM